MFRFFSHKSSRFARDERGVVLMLFLVLIVPLLILIAIAIDFSQFLVMKRQLLAAVDAAALDVASTPGLSDADAQARAQAFINANYPPAKTIGSLISFQVNRPDANTIRVTATGRLNTSFLKLAGYDTLDVTTSSQATRKENKLEIALVLDNTGSMAQRAGSVTKIDALKQASTTLINILFGSSDTSDFVKIALVPFTAAVNVGNATVPWWVDSAGVSPLNTENLDVQGPLIGLFSLLRSVSWGGCVRQRPEPYDLLDTPPNPAQPNTLFAPFFAPDEPDSGGFSNNYLPDGLFPNGTSQQTIERSVLKYVAGILSRGAGPNTSCPVKSVQPLTNQKTSILNAINGMTPNGNTVIPAGLMWGWHAISPNAPFALGAPYSDQTTVKAIVLLTDGENDISGGGNGFNKSVYSSYGYAAAGGHLGTDMSSGGPERALNQKLTNLCNNVKADHGNGDNRIVVYTIALGAGVGTTAANLLQNCATDSSKYFSSPTADELTNVFQKIALGLSQLRIAK